MTVFRPRQERRLKNDDDDEEESEDNDDGLDAVCRAIQLLYLTSSCYLSTIFTFDC